MGRQRRQYLPLRPQGGEGRGEEGVPSGRRRPPHLPTPAAWAFPLPPEGRSGISHRPDEMCALRRGSGCARPGPTSNRSSLVWKCGLPARRGEGCGAPPRAAPARPHIAKWLPRCRELRRVRETGGQVRRRADAEFRAFLTHLLWRGLARMRSAGEALVARNSLGNRAARWPGRNRVTPRRARSRCCSMYQATSSVPRSATTRGAFRNGAYAPFDEARAHRAHKI
jgi:hypothetical protein